MLKVKATFKHIKDAALQIAHDKPGRRFINYYYRSRQKLQEHPVKKVSMYIVAFLLIGTGFLFGFVPGAPGFFLGLPGLALIAARSKYFAMMMDRGEILIRRLFIREERRQR